MEQLSALAASTARQTLLFSATFPQPVHAAAQGLLRRPFLLRLGAAATAAGAHGGGAHAGLEEEGEGGDEGEEGDEGAGVESWRELSIPPQVAQHVVVAAEHKKPRKLLRLLESLGHGASPAARAVASAAKPGTAGHAARAAERRVLIFANKIKTAAFVAQLLAKHGVHAALLTSQLPQHAREAVLRRLAAAQTPVLVATDVAARGLHIEGAPAPVTSAATGAQQQQPAGCHPTAPEARPACSGRLAPGPERRERRPPSP